MTQFDTTPAYLHQVAGDTRTTAGTIGGQLSSLMTYCQSLNGPWMGDTEIAFQDLMVRFRNNANALNEALVNIAQELDQNATNYEEGEHSNQLQVVNIAGYIPPVNI
jgi:WXG100 family type VII secretion target